MRRGDHFTRTEGIGFELHDPFLNAQTIRERGAQAVPLSELLAQSDVVSVHCPRGEQTLGMFNASTFFVFNDDRVARFLSDA
ncbi:MAG: hypothetical protein JHD06_07980, partial [Rhodoferax sp.]|nr:hypothetical protein [Rhodoferax sp.]